MIRLKTRQSLGLNFRGFITGSVVYSTEATMGDFIDNAPVGAIGVYLLTSSGNQVDSTIRTTALPAGSSFTIIERVKDKKGNKIFRKTPITALNDINRKSSNPFSAATKQVTVGGYDSGSDSGDLNMSVIVPNTEFSVKIIDLTALSQPYPKHNFSYVTVANDTPSIITTKLVEAINASYNAGSGGVVSPGVEHVPVSASVETDGTDYGIKFMGDAGINFRVAFFEGLEGTPVNYDNKGIYASGSGLAVQSSIGSGNTDWMEIFEYEGNVFEGAKSQNDKFAEAYGLPAQMRDERLAYDTIYVGVTTSYKSTAFPGSNGNANSSFMIAAPSKLDLSANPDYDNILAQPSPITVLKTVLGV